MRKLFTLIFLLFSAINFAQLPQGFNYQAVVRNSGGDLLQNQDLTVKVSLLQGSSSSSSIYTETQSTQTNDYGLFNLIIGQGESSDNFTTIDWSDLPYYLKIEIDLGDGSGYTEIGTSQLLSVPFAMYSGNTDNSDDADADPTNELQLLSISNDTIYLSQGNFVKLPEASIPQQFSVSEFGDTLFFSEENYIIIPGASINNYNYTKYGVFLDYENYFYNILVTKTNDDNLIYLYGHGPFNFIKMDTLGQEIWTKSYEVGNIIMPPFKKIIPNNDGGATSLCYGSAPYSMQTILIKTNTSGDTLWSKVIEYMYDCRDIIQTSNNNYLIAANDGLAKLDESGDTLWTKRYSNSLNSLISDIYETADGDYLFMCSDTLYKTNASGDTLWTCSKEILNAEDINCIKETLDNNYLIVSASYNEDKSTITKLDQNKSILWSKDYTGSEYGGSLYNAFNLSNGDILLVGESGGGENYNPLIGYGENDIWILRVSSSGNILSSDFYGGGLSDSYLDSYMLSNNKVLIISKTASSDGNVPENSSKPDYPGLWMFTLDTN